MSLIYQQSIEILTNRLQALNDAWSHQESSSKTFGSKNKQEEQIEFLQCFFIQIQHHSYARVDFMFIKMNMRPLDIYSLNFGVLIIVHTIPMAEAETSDYWDAFINQTTKPKPKEHIPDLSILSHIDACIAPPRKRPQVAEKIHPLIQIANERKTKMGLQAEELINQRHRCKNYFEIQEQEQRKSSQRLLQKMVKKGPTLGSRRQALVDKPVRSRRTRKDRKSSDSEEDSLKQKRVRQTGPPYMPNVVCMDQLFKRSKQTQVYKKKEKRHAGSRSRSKLDRKLKARKRQDESNSESSPEKSGEHEKSSALSNMEIENDASKKISSPLDRLSQAKEAVAPSDYLFSSRSTKVENPHPEPSASIESTVTQKQEELVFPKRSEKLKLDQSISNEVLQPNDLKPYYKRCQLSSLRKQEEQLAERLRIINKRSEEIQKRQEQQKLKSEEDKRKKYLENLRKQIQKKEREMDEKEQRLKKANEKQASFKHKARLDQQKQKTSHRNKSRSKSPSHRSNKNSLSNDSNWKEQLRKITRYNPQDEKYKKRDQRDIQESGFAQMNIEEAHSRKMGKKEEQQEQSRYNQKYSKKRSN